MWSRVVLYKYLRYQVFTTGSNFNYLSKAWFPLSRNFYVRKINVCKWNRGNVLKVARKRKSRKSLNFTFNLKFLDLASILFTWLKFTCVNVRSQKRVSGNPPQRYVCVTDMFVRAAFLESVHYFGTSDYFSGRKKKEKNNLNDQNFKVYWKIRVEDRLKKIVDRGDMGRRL